MADGFVQCLYKGIGKRVCGTIRHMYFLDAEPSTGMATKKGLYVAARIFCLAMPGLSGAKHRNLFFLPAAKPAGQ